MFRATMEDQRMTGQLLGFIGIGRMGAPMAAHLLDAGYSLCVYDSNAAAMKPLVARGATACASAAEVASKAEIVLASLPTPPIVNDVALGETGVIKGSKIRTLIDLSTTGPGMATKIAGALAAKKIVLVDSPVSGGVTGAAKKTLAVMVSCPKATFAVIEPILKNFGKVFFTGEKPGLAQSAKLANNLMAAAALAITSEAMAMGVKSGLDAKVLLDIINVSSGRNTASMDKFPRAVLPGTFDFGFTTELSYKDVRLCVDEAEALGGAADAGGDQRQVRSAVGFHLDRQGGRGVGRRENPRLDDATGDRCNGAGRRHAARPHCPGHGLDGRPRRRDRRSNGRCRLRCRGSRPGRCRATCHPSARDRGTLSRRRHDQCGGRVVEG
jgi:3-hydroxyisobutyrate dehydrogenase-like beta-hydroxyacid dehydrogenase